jgi:hypothetical protein
MGLVTRKNQPFTTISKNSFIEGDSVVFIKGGSTIIEDMWVQFNDTRVDIKSLISTFINDRAGRVFNAINGILYVLITLNKKGLLEVVPSIAYNQVSPGNAKVFESLSNKLPLFMIKLEQDGSTDLSNYKPFTSSSYELYSGYGNFTLSGEQGATGPKGDTGLKGLDGFPGITGLGGYPGDTGDIGNQGCTGALGVAGTQGFQGVSIPRYVIETPADPIANFVGTPISGYSPLSVQFTNLSTGSWDSLLWDFGDGTAATSSNPLHIYSITGTYTVILYLNSVDYESRELKYDYITVSAEII